VRAAFIFLDLHTAIGAIADEFSTLVLGPSLQLLVAVSVMELGSALAARFTATLVASHFGASRLHHVVTFR
jgi:hypothetical protein